MDDKALLNTLIEGSLLSHELSQQIVLEAKQSDKTAEQIMYDRHLLDEESIAEAKSKLLGIPYKKIDISKITDEVLKLIPEETAGSYFVIPLELSDKTLVVGMIDPSDVRAQEALRFIAKKEGASLGVYIVTPTDIARVLRRYSPYQTQVDKAIQSLNIGKKKGSFSPLLHSVSIDEDSATVSEEAPIIKLVSSTLKEAVEQGASDIHIEPQRTRVRLRFRVDGILREVSSFPIELHSAIVSRVKILSNLKIDEMRIPQDGRFRTIIFSRDIDFRVSTFPTPVGEKVVIRVLDPTIGLKSIDNLGLIGQAAGLTKDAIHQPFGMVLITGPTGSGKTTTLYSLLQILNRDELNIVSLEDPVEYFIEGISQSQVRPEIGYTFASGLRQILRQDPDVIMVGEIRDDETAELAVHAALTGHVVLATLHTNNAIGVIPRLIDMKVKPFLLPSAINLMLSQRLVRRICQECKELIKPPESIQSIIKTELANLPKDMQVKQSAPYKTYRAKGCKECAHKAFVGRVALFEGLTMTRELEEITNTSPLEGKIRDEAKRQGMVGMRQDGILKALEGLILIEDVLRETPTE